jgi:hypothetical protein
MRPTIFAAMNPLANALVTEDTAAWLGFLDAQDKVKPGAIRLHRLLYERAVRDHSRSAVSQSLCRFSLFDGSWTQAKTGDLVRMPKGLPHATITSRRSRRGRCFPSRLRVSYASCSTNFTIWPIRERWSAARRSARWIF